MRETKELTEAFDEYYLMGDKRSLRVLAGIRRVSVKTAKKWSRELDWQNRIRERDRANAEKIVAKTDLVIVNTKADYRKDVKLALQPVKAAINKAIVKNPETGLLEVRIPIDEAKDLSSVITSFEKLIRLDLLLMGEADSSQEIILKLPGDMKEKL